MTGQLKVPTTAKITNITGDGDYNGKFKFMYTFSDGVIMTATHDTNASPFAVGQEVTYTINYQNDRGQLGMIMDPNKPQQKKAFGGGGSGWKPKSLDELKQEQLLKNPSMCLAYAKDFHSAVGFDKDALGEMTGNAQTITSTADVFLTWLNDRTNAVK